MVTPPDLSYYCDVERKEGRKLINGMERKKTKTMEDRYIRTITTSMLLVFG